MAVKVYLDPTGETIIVDNGTARVNTINVESFFFDRNDETEQVTLRDSNDDYKLTVASSDVQDELGTPIGTYQNVVDFLTTLVAAGQNGATEETLIEVRDNIEDIEQILDPATRTHNPVIVTGIGNVPSGSLRGSVFNSGDAAGTWNGISLPAGIGIPWGQTGVRDPYSQIDYDATGTTFIIEYTT